MSYMDDITLRPNQHFPPALKAIAKATNVPIKLGLVHFVIYFVELTMLTLADDR
jgi:hypothetical protein